MRRLALKIERSERTVRRWIAKAVRQAPVIGSAIAQLCYEERPDLPIDAQAAVGPAGVRGDVAGAMRWASLWQEVMAARESEDAMCGWAAVNVVGPLAGLWC